MANLSIPVQGGNVLTRITAAAGTPITVPTPVLVGSKVRISGLSYTAGGTPHTLTTMRSLGATTVATAALAGATTLTLASDPGAAIANPIAANDYIVVGDTSGTNQLGGVKRAYKVTSVAGLVLTLPALAANVAAGNQVWFFGVPADIDPMNGYAHPSFGAAASTTTSLAGDGIVGLVGAHNRNEPILLHSDNATASGTLVYLTYIFSDR